MLLNSIYGTNSGCGCSTCGCGNNNGTLYANTNTGCSTCGCNSCNNGGFGACGNNLGNAAYGFVGDWVNIVVTLTVLQSILGLVCNWNCGCGCGSTTYNN